MTAMVVDSLAAAHYRIPSASGEAGRPSSIRPAGGETRTRIEGMTSISKRQLVGRDPIAYSPG
jgi:hypothetical protein